MPNFSFEHLIFKLVILRVGQRELAQGPTFAHVSLVGQDQLVIRWLTMNLHLSTTIVMMTDSKLEMAISPITKFTSFRDCLQPRTLTDHCC